MHAVFLTNWLWLEIKEEKCASQKTMIISLKSVVVTVLLLLNINEDKTVREQALVENPVCSWRNKKASVSLLIVHT